jgi:hypothetical protein
VAAALNDVIKVVANQRQNGQLVQNVYHYQVVTLTGLEGPYLEIVRDWMINEVLPPILVIQSSQLVYESLFIINMSNGVDFLEHTFSPNLPGEGEVNVLPPYATMTFRLIRETLATRNGYKRFAGVPENIQQNGVYIGSEAFLTPIEEALAADIQPAPSIIPLFAPVIVRRGASGTIEAVNNIGASDFRGIGTQNTRKIGRGA